jgi:hypothetical protein
METGTRSKINTGGGGGVGQGEDSLSLSLGTGGACDVKHLTEQGTLKWRKAIITDEVIRQCHTISLDYGNTVIQNAIRCCM